MLILIGLDQLSKMWALDALASSSYSVFSFFRLHLTFNTGVAFSLPAPSFFIVGGTLLFLAGIILWMVQKKCSLFEHVGLVFVFSGGVGNLIDRLTRGEVIDFLSFWSFPVFNLADVFISVGVGVLFLSQIFETKSQKIKY